MTVDCLCPSLLQRGDYARLFDPPQQLNVLEWVETRIKSYRWAQTPYLREVALDWVDPRVTMITSIKSSQVGLSYFLNAMLAFRHATQTANTLYLLPSRDKVLDVQNNNLLPTFRECTDLQIKDSRNGQIQFPGSSLWLGSASNSKDLKSRQAHPTGDEIEEWPETVEGEGSPVQMALARETTYKQKKSIWISTPRHANGHISKLTKESTDHRQYHLKCPYCQSWAPLSFDDFKWAKSEGSHRDQAQRIANNPGMAWIECRNCKAHWTEADRVASIQTGKWVSHTQRIENGQVVGSRNYGKVSYPINSMFSLYVSIQQIVSGWLEVQDDPNARKAYLSQVLGQLPQPRPITPQNVNGLTITQVEAAEAKASNRIAGVVPKWAGLVVCGVDCQGGHFFHTTRAYGRVRSQLLGAGVCGSLDELLQLLNRQYPVEGCPGLTLPVSGMAVDMGGTILADGVTTAKTRVMQFAQKDARIWPCKGLGNMRQPWEISTDPVFGGQAFLSINSRIVADQVWELRDNKLWFLHSSVDPSYIASVDSVIPAIDPGTGERSYTYGARCDYWDSEVYGFALSRHLLAQDPLPDESELETHRSQPARQQRQITAADIASQLFPPRQRRWSA